ncbi:MAG TPA: DUF58 domain-containing protein [Candidatus Angelobacter sp.]|nr:DUF58 domain-containing protein [Candidatus Angelobacter sp.]
MFTPKAALYFLFAGALLALALILNDLEIGVLVLGLASLFFFSNIWGLPDETDIRIDREIVPNETFGEEEIRVESRIRNFTSSLLGNVEIHEALNGRIIPEKGTNYSPARIGPFEEFRFVFEFSCPPRANYDIGPLVVRARDPFGFYITEKKLEPETLSVMPRPEAFGGATLRPRHVGPWPGVIPSHVLGLGTEFYSMRKYIPGDDPKRINWKASARYNELFVNENEAERVTDVMIVLDTDVSFFTPTETELFEREVQAAASFARLLLRQGNRVGLVLQGGERGSIPAGFGKRHERRILYLLAAARPGRATVSTSYVMNLLARRMLPSRSQIVIISPLLDPEIKEGVKQLTIAGYSMFVLSPSPTLPASFRDKSQEIAFKLLMLERSITLLALNRSSTVVDWSEGVPLSALMSRVRNTRPVIPA